MESLFVIKWRGGAWGQGITQYLTYMQKETSKVHKDTCHCFGEKESFRIPWLVTNTYKAMTVYELKAAFVYPGLLATNM